MEGAVGGGYVVRNEVNNNNNNLQLQQQQQQQQQNHPHYENIYEPIAVAPAEESNASQQQQQAQIAQQQAQAVGQPQAPAEAPNGNNNNNNISNNNNLNSAAAAAQRLLPNINYRNDFYERSGVGTAAYDVPRSVRSGLGFRRNFQFDGGSTLGTGNRFSAARCTAAGAFYSNGSSSSNSSSCHRQRSFDDTESQNYYNLNSYQPSLRYENIYEQIRDEPIYRNTGAGARVYGRLNVIGHGIGRIERHLSSSCGNIDHYNLGGHYAVLGHSHFGTVGHIRLNAGGSGAGVGATAAACNGAVGGCNATAAAMGVAAGLSGSQQRDASNVKNSSSSFFSCLHGENSQSMSNVCNGMAMGNGSSSNGGTPNSSKERETRAAALVVPSNANNGSASPAETPTTSMASRPTGAIPKIKGLTKSASGEKTAADKTVTIKQALTKKTSSATTTATASSSAPAAASKTSAEHTNGTLNRISKSSLQWLLVNRWLPLWIGQGPECKVIDFNFMFSRDCVGCDAATSATPITNPYGTPRLGGMPQDLVRYNAAEMHEPPYGAAASWRRDGTVRPLHSTLNRLRGADSPANVRRDPYRYEDPSYENVHVQWQNGFEFGRSRDYEHSYPQQQQPPALSPLQQQSRPQLQRARSESPNFSTQQRRMRANSATVTPPAGAKYVDPFKKYELNAQNNTFRPKLPRMEHTESMDACISPPLPPASPAQLEVFQEPEGAVGGAALETAEAAAAAAVYSDNETEAIIKTTKATATTNGKTTNNNTTNGNNNSNNSSNAKTSGNFMSNESTED